MLLLPYRYWWPIFLQKKFFKLFLPTKNFIDSSTGELLFYFSNIFLLSVALSTPQKFLLNIYADFMLKHLKITRLSLEYVKKIDTQLSK